MRALSVRSALHINSQPILRIVILGVARVQVPNVLFSIHYSVFALFNYSGNRGCTLNLKFAQIIINFIPCCSVECTLLEKHKFCVNFFILSRDLVT